LSVGLVLGIAIPSSVLLTLAVMAAVIFYIKRTQKEVSQRETINNEGDAGEVWVATARDVPETEAYYDQMDYDYMDAETSGPTVTPKRIQKDAKDEDVALDNKYKNVKANEPKMMMPKKNGEDKECEDYAMDNDYENAKESGPKIEMPKDNAEDKEGEDNAIDDNYENAEASGPNLELPTRNEEDKGNDNFAMDNNYEN